MADQPRQSRARPRPSFALRLARDQGGATAVEFALVALPFLTLVFALMELGLVSLVSISLDNAIAEAGRTFRTGEVQTNQETAEAFKAKVCSDVGWIGATTCESALSVDVKRLPSFESGPTLPKPVTPCWDPGGPNSIVLVRAYYKWPLITPLLDTGLTSSDGTHEVSTAAVLTNEPYSDVEVPPVTCPA
jgi:Flp pilus assembly protein TadG